jgi:transcriptional regulator with XRE-family HTH domain
MSAKQEIGQRLREFGEKRYGTMVAFAEALGVTASHLGDYLNGRRIPGNRMQERLRKLGCDLTWLMIGQSKEELDKRADSMFIRKARELMPIEFAMIDRLKKEGVDTEEKLLKLLDVNKSILRAAAGMATYNKKKKGGR